MREQQRKKLSKLISKKKSGWIEEARYDQENRGWLKHSQRIALKILTSLKEQKVTQVQLSEKMGVTPQQVNKIVKGGENLTLETIAKVETALGINLIDSKAKHAVFVENFEELTQMITVPVHAVRLQSEFIYAEVFENLSKPYNIPSVGVQFPAISICANEAEKLTAAEGSHGYAAAEENYSYAMGA